MKLKVAFLLALALLASGTSMLVSLNVSAPKLNGVLYGITEDVGLPVEPCGDPVEGSDFPH